MTSRVIRRTHMYLALFLTPWVLMYTLSTFVMNHRAWFRGKDAGPPAFRKEGEFRYQGMFAEGASPREIGVQLLASLDMDGAFQANRRGVDGAVVVNRLDPLRPARLIYHPGTNMVTVERQAFEGSAFLERMHRRRGYLQSHIADTVWAVSVDFFIVAVLFWSGSGLWLWWEMKVTRVLGAAFVAAGCGLFAFFLGVL